MVRRGPIRVSAGEMDVLAMLWAEGSLSIAAAHERFGRFGPPCSYPTMQTRLNRLVEKGLVTRSAERPARYAAGVSADQVTAGHLRPLIDKLARGSVVPLVAHLLAERGLTDDELRELERLLAEARQTSSAQQLKRRSHK